MAGYNNYGNNQNRPYNNPAPAPVKAQPIPEDYVDAAEQVILQLDRKNVITNTKLRNLYSLITDISNVENLRSDPQILPESQTKLMMARVRMVYEAGRENSVKFFLQKTKLLEYLKDIGTDRKKLMQFSHYMEALVAYHRFYIGGKEK